VSLSDPEGAAARLLRWRWTLPLVALVGGAALWVATWPFWNNRFSLDVTAGYASVVAAERRDHRVSISLPTTAKVQISGYRVDEASAGLAPLATLPGLITLQADRIVLRTLTLTEGSHLAFARGAGGSQEILLRGHAALELTLVGDIRVSHGAGELKLVGESAPMVLTVIPGDPRNPMRISVEAPEPLPVVELLDQRVTSLRFTRPRPSIDDQRPVYRSEITAGTLRLLDVEQAVTLKLRDLVWFREESATLYRMAFTADGVVVEATGQARAMSIGPQVGEGQEARGDRNLTPTVFGYLLGRHDLKLLWGGAVGLLMALWKARQWALKVAT